MAISEQQAYEDIKKYIDTNGSNYKSWYAGATSDPKKRLFMEHKVSEIDGKWAYSPCADDTVSRNVEEKLIKLGCDGNPGGGDKTSTWVYAYLKTNETIRRVRSNHCG